MKNPSRRRFLAATCATVAAVSAGPTFAKVGKSRTLKMRNLHTGERLSTAYWADGGYLSSGLKKFNRLLRDHRANEVTRMDPKLFDIVYKLKEKLNFNGEIEIISGYRSPATNEKLRAMGRGVARRSYHTRGMALDIRMPGVPLSKLRRAALDLKAGGVGYYPKSNFVHVDTGPVRRW
ncbi:DUF882 domain-containing protein [Microbulbifer thermotolerans]|uniref:Murein endopeptidase K n=1 Tax=Microbulbifer thermotolerans TaxID=252514 RepID=A0A143HQ51_MICTH|nr:DUF882 domain-containing protein [Microbulbifer thermotolerans]AMX03550.1 hypothetical protein A3224_14060 [Microbulbifer thermotolerans]MCX2778174.1 DUF882 domain-containing protein [Microbulbifer thermotolerans]MCX2782192.1 DUF882 domain-containing protein [Microbulbifer thermotolerans]MCX2795284.1 DUF882 domain-containing protein [Microbulbifer thermotolerans]MCX2801154.1 DUF882 domain-containing protein [Microbulbifer thermotolerans]